MHTVRSTLTTTTNPLVLVVLVWALLWGFGATQVALPTGPAAPPEGSATSALADVDAQALWQASWSEQFPGCVARALWPQDERPVALLTRGPDGEVARVAPRASRSGQVVGVCR